jgi:transposase
MAQWSKLPLLKKPLVVTRQTGEKNGSKRHLLVDERGVPLSIVVTGANRHDVSQLAAVLDAIIVERPETIQHLCADKGYAGEPAQQIIKDQLYIPHVKQR